MISLADVILTQTIGQTSCLRFTNDLGHPEARLDGAVLDDVPLNLGVVQGHRHHAVALVHLGAGVNIATYYFQSIVAPV